jgi:methylmalonyl-CoA/ethylmalonyl-CoA epimerase
VIRAIHHVGIAVHKLDDAYRFYRDVLGLPLLTEATIADQGVRAALLAAGDSEIELLEPVGADSGMARFLARHGEGLHHVCFETPDVAGELTAAKDKGADLIDPTPRAGLAGQIGFLHPRSCAGVLVELATIEVAGSRASPARSGDSLRSASALRLKRVVIGAKEPRGTAAVFQRLFAFQEIMMNGGPRVLLGVGRGALLIVPSGEVGGIEGMVALSMVSDDFDGLVTSLKSAGTRGVLLGTGEVTLEPVATHGVHFHISRYE